MGSSIMEIEDIQTSMYIAKQLRVFCAASGAFNGWSVTLELIIGLGLGLIVLLLIVDFSVYCSCKKMRNKMLKELRMVEKNKFEVGKQADTKINLVYQNLETGHHAILVMIVTLSAYFCFVSMFCTFMSFLQDCCKPVKKV